MRYSTFGSRRWRGSAEHAYVTNIKVVETNVLEEHLKSTRGRSRVLLNDRLERVAYARSLRHVVHLSFSQNDSHLHPRRVEVAPPRAHFPGGHVDMHELARAPDDGVEHVGALVNQRAA